ncbi:hypothetical protein LZ30DRAFT_780866 [Colletotrichum cereale]|nr:hypothetical protein LZ30DRAFT_780866 [Colletotrichum cereale]
MKEDLKIQGIGYTYMLMCYTIAFAIMQIPSNLTALEIPPTLLYYLLQAGLDRPHYGNSCQANSYFAIYLRENGYSVTQRNIIPACANLVTMVTDFAWGFMSDMTGNRPLWIAGPLMCTTVVGSSILKAYDQQTQLAWLDSS